MLIVVTTSNAATLTVVAAPTITADTAPLNPSVLIGSTVNLVVAGTIPGTPAGVLSYQWQYRSSSAGTFANVGGATAAAYAATASTNGEQYRCILTNTVSAVTASTTSRITTITITSGLVAATGSTITPASSTVNPGAIVTLSNTVSPANATTPTYAWYSSASNSTSGGTPIAGQTASTYNPPTATAGTFWYYGTITAGGATVTAASAVRLTVRAAPTISVQPASLTIAAGGTAGFSITAADAGFPSLAYEWQAMPSGGAWAAISGATSSTYSTTSLANATQYRCLVTNAGGSGVTTTSGAATLTEVVPPTITTDTSPLNPTLVRGMPVNLSVAATIPATPAGTLSFQWRYRSSPSGAFADIVGATTDTHPAVATSNNEQYLCVATNTFNAVAVSTICRTTTFTVTASSPPVFTTQPASVSIFAGATASFTVTATGEPTPDLQWSESPDNITFTNTLGATASTYVTAPTTIGDVGMPRYYRCTATNISGSITSTVATRTVSGAPTGIAYINFTSSPAGGAYAPKHVMAAWIQSGSSCIATIGDWSSLRQVSLVLWNSVRGGTDAVMGATQLSHAQIANLVWHFTPGAMPDGTYSLWLESADANTGPIGAPVANSVPGANRTRLDFSIVGGSVVETTGAGGGFSGIRISAFPDPAAAAAAASGATTHAAGKVSGCGSGGLFALICGFALLLTLRRRRG